MNLEDHIYSNFMVELDDERLDAVFQALADSKRRTMLQLLSQGECSVGELGAPFRMSFAGASKHVKTLERAGLVSRTVQGRAHVCRSSRRRWPRPTHGCSYYEGFWKHPSRCARPRNCSATPSPPSDLLLFVSLPSYPRSKST